MTDHSVSLPDNADSEEQDISSKDFAETLQKLESIVERLEGGELGLEESLASFEQGVRLTREARQRLDSAESRVKVLLEKEDGRTEEQPYKGNE